VIEARNLTKYYGDHLAVENASFEVKKGEIVGFLGPNGAGKTTTLRMLTGYIPPSRGTATIAGYDVQDHPLEARRHLGYLPETVPLYTDMTVWDYLTFFGQLRGLRGRKLAARLDEVLQVCHLEEEADTIIGKLSKGYRQRVGLAQALLHEPEVLVLDEPTIGLDPLQVVETRQLIRALGKEHTIILSSHILPEVSMLCQRVIIMDRGRIVAVDTPERLSARISGIGHILAEVRGPAQEVASLLRQVPGVRSVSWEGAHDQATFTIEMEPDQDLRPRVAALIVRSGWDLLQLQRQSLTLEDIFVRLTTKEEL
jgi:ABC-2 type transport system ATP-binding protein